MSYVRDPGRALGYQMLFLHWVSKYLRVQRLWRLRQTGCKHLIGSNSLELSNGGNRGAHALKADALSLRQELTILFGACT